MADKIDPNPNELSPEQMLQEAEECLKNKDYGAARFYGRFALAIGSFDQSLVDARSIIAPDSTKTRQYLDRAKEIVKIAISPVGELETRLIDHGARYGRLKQQFGTEYSFQL